MTLGHETDQDRRRLASRVLHVAKGPPGRRLFQAVEGHALEERLQDLRTGHGRASRRHGQRGRPLSRKSAKNRCRRWPPTCKARSRPEFFETYSIAQLQAFSPRELETCGRFTTRSALARGEQYYRPIGWDDALRPHRRETASSRCPNETFWYFSGRSSNEAGFLLQLFARMYGTNNVNNCSYYCHQASGVGLN